MAFNPKDVLWLVRRSRSYKDTFTGNAAEEVLGDLFRVCRIARQAPYDSTGAMDPLALAENQGRRMVFSHIMEQLGLDETEWMKKLQAQGDMP